MPRAIWSGSISFGLVNVPVKVFTAVREHTVHFHQVEKGTGSRIRYEKVSDRSGHKVPNDGIGLAYELSKGQLVTVDPDQLAELRPRSTRTIEIADFVDIAEIDPVFYDRTYWLGPDGEPARRPYALLAEAMTDRHQVGIGTMVMRNKQYLAAIRPRQDVLALSTMHFADELVARSSVDNLPSKRTAADPKELRLATQIIDSLRTGWDPGRYHDTYTDQVKDLIERQAAGEQIVVEAAPVQEGEVVDLMSALEASLRAAKEKTPGRSRAGRSAGSQKGKTGSGASSRPASRSTGPTAEATKRKAATGKTGTRKSA